MHPQLRDTAVEKMNRKFELKNRAVDLLELVVAEWNSDPMSAQCFDSRIVKDAKEVVRELRALGELVDAYGSVRAEQE